MARTAVSIDIDVDIDHINICVNERNLAIKACEAMGLRWDQLTLEEAEWWERLTCWIVDEINRDPDNFDFEIETC